MRCENYTGDLGAYFLEGRRASVPCKREAAWIVSVNPPRGESDGRVRLCEHCNKFDYLGFPREKLTPAAIAAAV